MHRGFSFYYGEALKASAKTIYKNRCFFNYILYFLAEFFGRLFIIFNAHFNLAAVRQGYVIRKCNLLNFSSSFKDTGKRTSIWTYILALCFEGLIIIAGLVALSAVTAILGAIGYGVSELINFDTPELLIYLFAVPGIPLCSLYLLVIFLIFSPTAYIIANNEGISAGETIASCFRSMLNRGKITVFLTYFVSNLLKILYLTAVGVGGYFLFLYVVPTNLFVPLIIVWCLVAFAVYLTFAPILTLANRVVKERLFEDIVLDPVTAVRLNEKVNLKECDGKAKTEVTVQNLASLFEYTDDPYRILEKTEKKSQIFILPTDKKERGKERTVDLNSAMLANGKNVVHKSVAIEGIKPETAEQEKKTEVKPLTEPVSASERIEVKAPPVVKTEEVKPQPTVNAEEGPVGAEPNAFTQAEIAPSTQESI